MLYIGISRSEMFQPELEINMNQKDAAEFMINK